jgi:hypothetical protein
MKGWTRSRKHGHQIPTSFNYGIDLEAEIADMMAQEIQAEIDREIVESITGFPKKRTREALERALDALALPTSR